MFFVYILAAARRGRTYIGQTNNLVVRQRRHARGHGARYPFRYRLERIVYVEIHDTRQQAMSRERALKALYDGQHDVLYALIEQANPHWLALDASRLDVTVHRWRGKP